MKEGNQTDLVALLYSFFFFYVLVFHMSKREREFQSREGAATVTMTSCEGVDGEPSQKWWNNRQRDLRRACLFLFFEVLRCLSHCTDIFFFLFFCLSRFV